MENNKIYLPNKEGHYKEVTIPKYILEILPRIKNQYDYVFKLKAKYEHGQNKTLFRDMKNIKIWAEKYFAECEIIENNDYWRSKSERQRGVNVPYYIFTLTDPVCYQLEKIGYLK